MKPREFGIRVRDDSDRLQITARNKMRNAKTEYEFHSFYGHYMETPYLSANAATHRTNYAHVCRLIQTGLEAGLELKQKTYDKSSERYIMEGVPKMAIFQLLRHVDVTRYNKDFDTSQIADFIFSCQDNVLNQWDVAFIPGTRGGKTYSVCGTNIWRATRNHCKLTDDKLQIGSRSKLGGPRDGTAGLTEETITLAEEAFKNANPTYTGSTYSSVTWFKHVTKRNPLLAIYLIEVDGYENQTDSFNEFRTALGENTPVVGFAVGFPNTATPITADKFRFKANRYYNFFEENDDIEEGGDE